MSEPVRFDHAGIAQAAIDLHDRVRQLCPLKGGPAVQTGSPFRFDSDVAAYSLLCEATVLLARLLNPDGQDRLIGTLAWESTQYFYQFEPDRRQRHALLKVWKPSLADQSCTFWGIARILPSGLGTPAGCRPSIQASWRNWNRRHCAWRP
jgi:hypothetical protein